MGGVGAIKVSDRWFIHEFDGDEAVHRGPDKSRDFVGVTRTDSAGRLGPTHQSLEGPESLRGGQHAIVARDEVFEPVEEHHEVEAAMLEGVAAIGLPRPKEIGIGVVSVLVDSDVETPKALAPERVNNAVESIKMVIYGHWRHSRTRRQRPHRQAVGTG